MALLHMAVTEPLDLGDDGAGLSRIARALYVLRA